MPTFVRPSKIRGFQGFGLFPGKKKPGHRYRKTRLLLRDLTEVTVGYLWRCYLALAWHAGFASRDSQTLTSLPQAFAADPQFSSQFGLGHMVLMLKDEVLEVVFQ